MFGKPNLANADVMLAEVSNLLTETATALEAEHPDPSATDAQALVVWTTETILHVILDYGRTDAEAIRDSVFHLTLTRFQRPAADQWEDSLHDAEAKRLKAALALHVRGSRPRLSEAAAAYYRGLASLEPKPALSEEQFVRVAATAMAAGMTRLQNAGYIKVR